MVSTKTFDNIEKENELDKLFKSISKDLEKVRRNAESKAIINLIRDYKRLNVELTTFLIVQMIINILLCLAIVLK